MIIRILGEDQYDVPDAKLGQLNVLDAQLQAAVDANDPEGFGRALRLLLAAVREVGETVPERVLTASDLVLPAEDTDLERVSVLLGDEGLIPD